MYNAVLTRDLPPQMQRCPLNAPLSRLKGATPTSAAICRRLSLPSSGSNASMVLARTGPAPGTPWMSSLFSRHSGRHCMALFRSRSTSFRHRSRKAITAWMFSLTCSPADLSRFRSAVIISTSCRWRFKSASSSRVFSSRTVRGSGRTDCAYRAITNASMLSVLARRPRALAKARTCRGLTTASGNPAPASTCSKRRSRPTRSFHHDKGRR